MRKGNILFASFVMLGVTACSFGNQTSQTAGFSLHPEAIHLPPAVEAPPPIKGPRNMVYIAVETYPDMKETLEKFVDIVTDYNIFLLNPTDLANGDIDGYTDAGKSDLEYLIRRVREERPDARIYLSFGGWRGKEFDLVYEEIARNPESRRNFINNIIAIVEKYKVDGVDMDWEYPRVIYKDEYALFIRELANALHSRGKRLSAAVIGVKTKKTDKGDGAAYSDSVLSDFDNINLMVYDIDFENHSTYEDAIESIRYWVKERGVPPYKAILGVPLYARNDWIPYGFVVGDIPSKVPTAGPVNACHDSFVHEGRVNYYNGLPTIARKTRLAMAENLGGIMLFDLMQDARHDQRLSAIRTVDAILNGTGFKNYCDEKGLSETR